MRQRGENSNIEPRIKFNSTWYDFGYMVYRWVKPVLDPISAAHALPSYLHYVRDSRMPGAETRHIFDSAPILGMILR